MNRTRCLIAVSLFQIGLSIGVAEAVDQGRYEGNVAPPSATPAWRLLSGQAVETQDAGRWVVASPENFCRHVGFQAVAPATGQRNEVTLSWSVSGASNNFSADGFRIVTQGRVLRLHPLDRADGEDLLLTGTPRGMRPDIRNAVVDLRTVPSFEASRLNTFEIRWVTNDDDTYGFAVRVNGHSIGTLPGEPLTDNRAPSLAFEFRSGTHRVDFVRWKLHRGGEPLAARPIVVSGQAQLLLDDHLIAQSGGLVRTMHQPEMHTRNPVLSPREPWEYGAILLWGTVLYDAQDRLFKMWYMTWGNDAGGALPGWRTPVCYATSRDGLKWDRPKLDLYPFRYRDLGNDGQIVTCPVNNIVFNLQESPLGMDSPTVVKDLDDPDPQFRYKMTYWHRLPTGTGIYQAHSPDGIHWTHIPRIVANTGDRNTFHWDPFIRKWIVVSRPSGSFYPLERFGHPNQDTIRTSLVLEPQDRERFPDCRMYSCPVLNYAGLQLALPELYSLERNRWVSYLAWSYNGVKWRIDPQRQPWMPWNPIRGTFDSWRRNIHNGGVIRRGDRLWIYFSGRSQGKNIPDKAGFLIPSGKPGFDPRGILGSVGLAKLRVDGFVSRDAGATPGFLVTRPLRFRAQRLFINADIGAQGSIKGSLLTADGRPIEQFSSGVCKPLAGDRIDHRVEWRGGPSLQAVAGTPVRLRLDLRDARLYSFRFGD